MTGPMARTLRVRGDCLKKPWWPDRFVPMSGWFLLGINVGRPYKGKEEKQKKTTRVKGKDSIRFILRKSIEVRFAERATIGQ